MSPIQRSTPKVGGLLCPVSAWRCSLSCRGRPEGHVTDPGARGHGMGLTWLLSSPAVGFCPVQGDAIYLVLQVVKAQS